jgi:hypothetical protein
MRQLQLYLWPGARRRLLERHDFYVAQVKGRVLSQFANIDHEAEVYAEAEFDRLGRVLDPEVFDAADGAEIVFGRAQEFYSLLDDLRGQMLLGALAGLYHQWDKDLRNHLDRELRHYLEDDEAQRLAWSSNSTDVLSKVAEFGWDCRKERFFRDIDACRLVVNVHKHGKGASLAQLAERYPEFLPSQMASTPWGRGPDHEKLEISLEQFDSIARALREFWEDMPERLYLEVRD